MTSLRFFLVFVFISIHVNSAYSQKQFKTKGEAQVKVEDHSSKEATRAKAKDLAIIKAIENVLGTYVEQETNIDIESGKTNFKIIGNTRVKGDWIKTAKESYTEQTREVKNKKEKTTEIWITCKIEGIVREIVKPKLAFTTNALNCPKALCRTTRYLSGESFYLHFKSPSKGYLSVYLVEEDAVYRLLPYQEMSSPYVDAVPVQADKDYIFFSQEEQHNYFKDFPLNRVDELVMETEQNKEYMKLYLVFSTEEFSKPILNAGEVIHDGSLPKSLTSNKFEEWIVQNRIYNAAFNYDILNLEIVKQ
jgi:hypothetical protein